MQLEHEEHKDGSYQNPDTDWCNASGGIQRRSEQETDEEIGNRLKSEIKKLLLSDQF